MNFDNYIMLVEVFCRHFYKNYYSLINHLNRTINKNFHHNILLPFSNVQIPYNLKNNYKVMHIGLHLNYQEIVQNKFNLNLYINQLHLKNIHLEQY